MSFFHCPYDLSEVKLRRHYFIENYRGVAELPSLAYHLQTMMFYEISKWKSKEKQNSF